MLRAAMAMTYPVNRKRAAKARELHYLRTNPKSGDKLPLNKFLELLGTANGVHLWSWMTMSGALAARLACKGLRDSATAWPWDDLESRVYDVALWHRCFPHARACFVAPGVSLTDVLLRNHLSGPIDRLLLGHQPSVSDAGLSGLGGVRLLQISGSAMITDAGLAYLQSVEVLSLAACCAVTDVGVEKLTKVRFLDVSGCLLVTGQGLEALARVQRGVRVLDLDADVQQSLLRGDGRVRRLLTGVTRLVVHDPPMYQWGPGSFASLAEHLAAMDKQRRCTWGSNHKAPAVVMLFQPSQPARAPNCIKQWLAWDSEE